MTAVDRGPTRVSSGIAVAAAVLTFVVSGPYAWVALAASGFGLVSVAVGVLAASRAAVTVGSAALFVGALATGVAGTPAAYVLAGAVGAVVAWDAGGTAIDLGAQLGRAAETARLELVHAASTAVVGTVAAGGSWALYRASFGSRPLTVPTLLLIAALCIAVALAVGDE